MLGFEFGYSLDAPDTLVLWEAQFGDFATAPRSSSTSSSRRSESKWQRDSGLVMLLPHGYEGQGPEHSSARLERFLQLCAEDNMQVCISVDAGPVLPHAAAADEAQLPQAADRDDAQEPVADQDGVSPVSDLVNGRFHEVLDDATATPERVRRVLLCSGKVYYELAKLRTKTETDDVAIVRVEQFYPFPEELLQRALARYRKAEECVWVQEESQNMGGWSFMEPRLRALGYPAEYVGRDASASPATGSHEVHKREQEELVEAAIRGNGAAPGPRGRPDADAHGGAGLGERPPPRGTRGQQIKDEGGRMKR